MTLERWVMMVLSLDLASSLLCKACRSAFVRIIRIKSRKKASALLAMLINAPGVFSIPSLGETQFQRDEDTDSDRICIWNVNFEIRNEPQHYKMEVHEAITCGSLGYTHDRTTTVFSRSRRDKILHNMPLIRNNDVLERQHSPCGWLGLGGVSMWRMEAKSHITMNKHDDEVAEAHRVCNVYSTRN